MVANNAVGEITPKLVKIGGRAAEQERHRGGRPERHRGAEGDRRGRQVCGPRGRGAEQGPQGPKGPEGPDGAL